jgi:hypothetical protein
MYADDDPRIYVPSEEPREEYTETVTLPSELIDLPSHRREIIRQMHF